MIVVHDDAYREALKQKTDTRKLTGKDFTRDDVMILAQKLRMEKFWREDQIDIP